MMTVCDAAAWFERLKAEKARVECGPDLQPCRYGPPDKPHGHSCACEGARKMRKVEILADIELDMEISAK